jgi:hypothetical protein
MQFAAANPARLVAILAVAAVVGGGFFVFKATQGSSSTSPSQPKLLHASTGSGLAHLHAPGAHKTVTHTRMKHVTPAQTTPGHTAKHTTAKAVHRPAAVHRAAVAPSGLPWSVANALKRSPIVVVAVISPKSIVDEYALAEAKAGAKLQHAGFVEVNAYSQRQIAPFDSTITVSANPAILIMKRPTQVTLQMPGFADRASVEQAIDDARISASAPTAPTP